MKTWATKYYQDEKLKFGVMSQISWHDKEAVEGDVIYFLLMAQNATPKRWKKKYIYTWTNKFSN